MHNTSFLMQVFQRLRHLHNHMSTQVLAKVRKTDNLMEELAAWAELQNDVVILSGFGEVDEADDVGVVELSHYLDLFENIRSLEHSDVSKICVFKAMCK